MKKTALLLLLLSAVVLVLINKHLPAESPTPIVSRNIPLEVTIVSSDGKPVPDAEVWFCTEKNIWNDTPTAMLKSGHSDASGKFSASTRLNQDVPFYSLFILARSAKNEIGTAFINGHVQQDSLPYRSKIVLAPAGTVKLRVLTPDGAPASGITLRVNNITVPHDVTRRSSIATVPLLPDGLWQAKTDTEGRCEITSLPLSSRIYIKHNALSYAQPSGKYEPLKWLKINADETPLTLASAGGLHGIVVTPEGTPINGASVSILEDSHPYVTAYGDSVFADDKGRFTISQIPPSNYKLSIDVGWGVRDRWIGPNDVKVQVKAGETSTPEKIFLSKVAIVTMRILNSKTGAELEPPIITRLPAGTHDIRYRAHRLVPPGFEPVSGSEAVAVTVKEGERVTVDFKLTPADKTRLVTGTVFDSTGKPASLASVLLSGFESREFPIPVKTDEAGKFSISPTKDASSFLIYACGKDNTISDLLPITPGSQIDLKLKQNDFASIRGRIIDDSGNPIPDASVQWHSRGFNPGLANFIAIISTTDSEGRYTFPRLWNGRTYDLSCKVEGVGSTYQKDIKPSKGEALTVNFTLTRPNQTLAGVVVDSAGKPVANASISGSGNGQGELYTITNAQGLFRFDKVVQGMLLIRASVSSDDLHVEAYQKVKSGQQDVRIVLPEAKQSIAGIVIDETGKPLPLARIWSNGRTIKGDRDGGFIIKGIVEGWHSVDFTVQDTERGTREKRFRLKAGMHNSRIVMPDQQPVTESYPEEPPNMIGKEAPELRISAWVQGRPFTPKPNGKVRIIDFWNTQCAPCIATFQKIQAFFDEHSDLDLEFIALHCANPTQEVQEFLQKHPQLKFPVAVSAEDGRNELRYGIRGNPTYIVIDKHGKIISHGHDWAVATTAALNALKLP